MRNTSQLVARDVSGTPVVAIKDLVKRNPRMLGKRIVVLAPSLVKKRFSCRQDWLSVHAAAADDSPTHQGKDCIPFD